LGFVEKLSLQVVAGDRLSRIERHACVQRVQPRFSLVDQCYVVLVDSLIFSNMKQRVGVGALDPYLYTDTSGLIHELEQFRMSVQVLGSVEADPFDIELLLDDELTHPSDEIRLQREVVVPEVEVVDAVLFDHLLHLGHNVLG